MFGIRAAWYFDSEKNRNRNMYERGTTTTRHPWLMLDMQRAERMTARLVFVKQTNWLMFCIALQSSYE